MDYFNTTYKSINSNRGEINGPFPHNFLVKSLTTVRNLKKWFYNFEDSQYEWLNSEEVKNILKGTNEIPIC